MLRHYNTVLEGGEGFVEMNFIPDKVTLSQYTGLLFDSPVYLHQFWNSVKIVFPILVGQLIVSSMAGYVFAVCEFKGKNLLFFLYIIVMLLPLQVTLMPNYMIADWLNMTDSYLAVILPGIFHPFGVFLFRQFFRNLPSSCIEAAKLDGAGHGTIFLLIAMPLIKPGIAAFAMLTLLDYWNLVDQAIIFIQNQEKQPLSIFLAHINNKNAGSAFAGACFYALPVLIVLFYGQKHLKSGIAAAGLQK